MATESADIGPEEIDLIGTIHLVLNQLNLLINSREKNTDDRIKSNIEQLRGLLKVQRELWTVGDNENTLHTVIKTFQNELEELEHERTFMKHLNPCEALASASSGRALKGILIGNDRDGVHIKKPVLSSTSASGSTFGAPASHPPDEVEDFTSVEQLDHFNQILESLGYEAALRKRDYRKQQGLVNLESGAFYSRMKLSVVPTASLKLNADNLRLVSEVLDELKLIDSAIDRDDDQLATKKCEKFFKLFGSHVTVGPFTFGGISKLEVFYTSSGKPVSNAEMMVGDILKLCVAMENSGQHNTLSSIWSVEKACTPKQKHTLDTYDISELKCLQVQVTRSGPPSTKGLSSLPFWKLALATVNKKWDIVDRGNTVGIWHLISNHTADFKNPGKLSATLEREWSKKKSFLLRNVHINEDTKDMLEKLGVVDYFPGKISIQEVMSVREPWRPGRAADLPWQVLQKLLMINYQARDHLVSEFNEQGKSAKKLSLEQLLNYETKATASELHPMDVLLLLFGCCDRFLQQVLAQKLHTCQLAVPYMYPHGSSNNLVMSLWALRAIIIEWRNAEEKPMESSVTSASLPVITFIRLGRPHLSKSKLVNDVLRNESHDTFFHCDCLSGTAPRKLSDGLVECTWFLPAGARDQALAEAATVLNLRGDGCLLPVQISVLSSISSIMVVIANGEDLGSNPLLDTFKQMCQKDVKIVVLLTTKNPVNPTSHMRELNPALQREIGDKRMDALHFILGFNRETLKNPGDIKRELRQALSQSNKEQLKIERQAELASFQGVIIDENDSECLEGKRLSMEVTEIMEGFDAISCKEHLLPLQGKLWRQYSKLLKKQHRTGRSSLIITHDEINNIAEEMQGIRQNQMDLYEKPSSLVEKFISNLKESIKSPVISRYFLQWLKFSLDEKSRLLLPSLRNEYNEAWKNFQEAKKENNKKEKDRLQRLVREAEENLADASLGLEHIFRELGQMYEASAAGGRNSDTMLSKLVEGLPKIVCQLLLEGHPLELVDGDASNIPVTWIKAVLKNVRECIGKKKLFVLSVLGIQGSGKSTLLNTMFGLQFAVSAGRCTRGAFMQLVPLGDKVGLPCSYIAVVDTEGLRAPELGNLNYEHDNELATLTIGLADVTLINIQSENAVEMNDTLQIAVHALMRMKMVEKKVQACMFLHQNVAAISAKEKMMPGRQKLQETLDTKTKEAAEQENIFDIHSFSQIIAFDVEKHVHYFSALWRGDPPMASANPGYSNAVDTVKKVLIEDTAVRQGAHVSIMDLSRRVEDLWRGILSDDFVFCFRNSLEVKVYNMMEAKYHELKWQFESAIDDWLQNTAEVKLICCEDNDALDITLKHLETSLDEEISKTVETTLQALDQYFEESDKRDMLIQWQGPKQVAVKTVAEQKRNQGIKVLREVAVAWKVQLLDRKTSDRHISLVMEKAVQLAERYRDKNPSNEEIEREFNTVWKDLELDFASKNSATDLPVHEMVEKQLRAYVPQGYRTRLQQELLLNPLREPVTFSKLEGSLKEEDVSRDDVGLKTSLQGTARTVEGLFTPQNSAFRQAQRYTALITQGILQDISGHLSRLQSQTVKLHTRHATEVIRKITFRFDEHNKEAKDGRHSFTIKDSYTVKVAVHICRYCVKVFESIQADYEEKHGAVGRLERYKNAIWQVFETKVKQHRWETVAADIFCDAVKDVVETAVRNEIRQRVVRDMIARFGYSKFYLIVDILESLAKAEDFSSYMLYVEDAKSFAFKWITTIADEEMFGKRNYEMFAGEALMRHMAHIKSGVKQATDLVVVRKPSTKSSLKKRMEKWINAFCNSVQAGSSLKVTKNTLRLLVQTTVEDFRNMASQIEVKLQELMKTLEEKFKQYDRDSVKWGESTPYEQIVDRLWGCPKQCPFCKEPCSHTTEGHYPSIAHRCVQHKPQGIGGRLWTDNRQLKVETCNYSVQTYNEFRCDTNNYSCRVYGGCKTTGKEWVWHPYREYRKYVGDWDIAPSPANIVSEYWMWFMAKYQRQLKLYYREELPEVPRTWYSVSKEAAIANLRDYFGEECGSSSSSSSSLSV